jgi:hypothetical protein
MRTNNRVCRLTPIWHITFSKSEPATFMQCSPQLTMIHSRHSPNDTAPHHLALFRYDTPMLHISFAIPALSFVSHHLLLVPASFVQIPLPWFAYALRLRYPYQFSLCYSQVTVASGCLVRDLISIIPRRRTTYSRHVTSNFTVSRTLFLFLLLPTCTLYFQVPSGCSIV